GDGDRIVVRARPGVEACIDAGGDPAGAAEKAVLCAGEALRGPGGRGRSHQNPAGGGRPGLEMQMALKRTPIWSGSVRRLSSRIRRGAWSGLASASTVAR